MKVWCVKVYWKDEDESSFDEHFVSCEKRPSIAEAVKALEIDYRPEDGESIRITSLHIVPIPARKSKIPA